MDAIDVELNQVCSEVADEYEYNQEDPLAVAKGLLNTFVFTFCFSALLFAGAVIVRAFQR